MTTYTLDIHDILDHITRYYALMDTPPNIPVRDVAKEVISLHLGLGNPVLATPIVKRMSIELKSHVSMLKQSLPGGSIFDLQIRGSDIYIIVQQHTHY